MSLVARDWLYGHRVGAFRRSGPSPRQGADTNKTRLRLAAIAFAVVLVLGVGGYAVFSYVRPYLHATGCRANGVSLALEQAANAATIAMVAAGRELPERALVIGYATAIQESHIRNLPGGDRDSVGLFQQRPSQGWGSRKRLMDPVYAANRFFDVLVKVRNYLDRPVHDAAQRVQRSADGSAYAQHVTTAQALAAAYLGRRPASVTCYATPGRRTPERRAAALGDLRRALDSPRVLGDRVRDDSVGVGSRRTGWTLAAWAVSHAQPYGLTEIRYAGWRWTADRGYAGWSEDDQAPAGRVIVR